MREDLRFPRVDAMRSVLQKLGLDPATRYLEDDQDYEYTTCRVEELPNYIELYRTPSTTEYEKRLLGCYFLECLNDCVLETGKAHPQQEEAFKLLFGDLEIHQSEIEYWMDTSDANEDNWWPIAKHLIKWNHT